MLSGSTSASRPAAASRARRRVHPPQGRQQPPATSRAPARPSRPPRAAVLGLDELTRMEPDRGRARNGGSPTGPVIVEAQARRSDLITESLASRSPEPADVTARAPEMRACDNGGEVRVHVLGRVLGDDPGSAGLGVGFPPWPARVRRIRTVPRLARGDDVFGLAAVIEELHPRHDTWTGPWRGRAVRRKTAAGGGDRIPASVIVQ